MSNFGFNQVNLGTYTMTVRGHLDVKLVVAMPEDPAVNYFTTSKDVEVVMERASSDNGVLGTVVFTGDKTQLCIADVVGVNQKGVQTLTRITYMPSQEEETPEDEDGNDDDNEIVLIPDPDGDEDDGEVNIVVPDLRENELLFDVPLEGLRMGQTVTFSVNGTDDFEFSSSDSEVVTITAQGLMTVVGAGQAIISAMNAGETLQIEQEITIETAPLVMITPSPASISISEVGQTGSITYTKEPWYTTDAVEVEISTVPEGILALSATGEYEVVELMEGMVILTAETPTETITASIPINVVQG